MKFKNAETTELISLLNILKEQVLKKISLQSDDELLHYKLLTNPNSITKDYIKKLLSKPKPKSKLDYDDRYSIIYKIKKLKFRQGLIKYKKLFENLREAIFEIKDPIASWLYAHSISKKREPELENIILEDFGAATMYASAVIKDRWPKLEKKFEETNFESHKVSGYIDTVVAPFGRRWLKYEKHLLNKEDALYAYRYAAFVLKSRWPEAEKFISKHDRLWNSYKEKFGIKEN